MPTSLVNPKYEGLTSGTVIGMTIIVIDIPFISAAEIQSSATSDQEILWEGSKHCRVVSVLSITSVFGSGHTNYRAANFGPAVGHTT